MNVDTEALMAFCEETLKCESCGGDGGVYQPLTKTVLCAQTVRYMQKIQPEAHAGLIIKDGAPAEKPTVTVEVDDEEDDDGTWTGYVPLNPN